MKQRILSEIGWSLVKIAIGGTIGMIFVMAFA